MGKREREEGTLVLPSAAVVSFRKAIVAAMNAERAKVLEAATAVYDYLNTADAPTTPGAPAKKTRLTEFKNQVKKSQHTKDWAARQAIYSIFEKLDGRMEQRWDAPKWNNEVRYQASHLLIKSDPKGNVKLVAPKKKDYPPLPASTSRFEADSAYLAIDAEKRTVTWDVDESKNAVENAWESAMGKAFKKALESVKWTRDTGGVFRYADEYGMEASMDHGGNPIRISQHFGPRGVAIFESENGYNPVTMKFKRR